MFLFNTVILYHYTDAIAYEGEPEFSLVQFCNCIVAFSELITVMLIPVLMSACYDQQV